MSVTIKKYERSHNSWWRFQLLGRHIRHDSRSLNYTFPVEGLTIKSVVHPRHIPMLDQGKIGDCTSNAGIGNLGTSPMFETLPTQLPYSLNEHGAIRLYSDEETLNGDGPYPPNDNGSDGLTCAKILKQSGLISSYQHCFDADSALKALSVIPFMFGCDWHRKMFNPDQDGRVLLEGPVVGGHEILCREYDQANDRLWFDNSWTADWGVAGRFYLTAKDFEQLLKHDGDVVILLPFRNSISPVRRRRKFHHHHHHA